MDARSFLPLSSVGLGRPHTNGASKDGGEVAVEQVEEVPVEVVMLPVHHFDAEDDGGSIINSAILAYLSM